MEQKCLECHGAPAAAPHTVIERYGTTHGFGWQVGDIVSALMIYVPTADLQAQIVSMLRTLLGTFGVFDDLTLVVVKRR